MKALNLIISFALAVLLYSCNGADQDFVKSSALTLGEDLEQQNIPQFEGMDEGFDSEIEDESTDVVDSDQTEHSTNDKEEVEEKPQSNAFNACSHWDDEAAKYHVSTSDNRCVWSCSVGTTPDNSSGECLCQDGMEEVDKDEFGRRVCETPVEEKTPNLCEKNFSGDQLLYHVFTNDGRCVWSCSQGTTPDNGTKECSCKDGYVETGKDQFGRRVCEVYETPTPEKEEKKRKKRKAFGIWLDMNNNGKIDKKDIYKGEIEAYKGDLKANKNYNYYSWSAHPIVGPKPSGFESHVFLYEGKDGLSLFFYHNVDAGGSKYNRVKWDITTKGNNLKDKVLLSDDRGELKIINKNKKKQLKKYKFNARYWKNTDGGIIGPFVKNKAQVHVKVKNYGDIISSSFYSSDGKVINLKKKQKIRSFILKLRKPKN